MGKILAIRIAGQVKKKVKDLETLKRLNLFKKFTSAIIDESDSVKMGMINSVSHMVAFGSVDDSFIKKLDKRKSKKESIFHLHPPRGGFKKSSKVAFPKGILGRHEDITKLAGRML